VRFPIGGRQSGRRITQGTRCYCQVNPWFNGIFDVVIDDQLVFSRLEEKRFPQSGEIIKKLLG
jgi:selT/selW/selH-like putative selenoprotein